MVPQPWLGDTGRAVPGPAHQAWEVNMDPFTEFVDTWIDATREAIETIIDPDGSKEDED